jgi:hypothetical protein
LPLHGRWGFLPLLLPAVDRVVVVPLQVVVVVVVLQT